MFRSAKMDMMLGKYGVLRNPEKQKDVMSELESFVKLDKVRQYLPDWFAIYDLLSTPGLFATYMKKLEKELVEFNKTLKADIRPRDRLINFFNEWAKLQGFTGLAMLDKLLEIDEFHTKILRTKFLFVDTYTGFYEHGEWPHVLQWYVVAKHLQTNPKYLQHDLQSIYASFADAQIISDERNRSAWNFFFDSYYDNYTNPIFVTRQMTDYQCQYVYPELSSSIMDDGRSLRYHL